MDLNSVIVVPKLIVEACYQVRMRYESLDVALIADREELNISQYVRKL